METKETKEIITGEIVYRSESAGKSQKHSKSWFKVLISVFAVVAVVTLVAIIIGKNNKNAAAAEVAAEENITETTDETADEADTMAADSEQAADEDPEAVEEDPEAALRSETEDEEITGDEELAAEDSVLSDEEIAEFFASIGDYTEDIVGVYSHSEDISDIYTANDPELPSYLTKSYNPDFKMDLTENELYELMRIVEAEAPSEDIYGKILIANVVLNRVLSDGFANDVVGVIYQRFGSSVQFSSTAISWYWNSIQISDSTRQAVMRALSGEDYSDGALYFYGWKECTYLSPTKGWVSAHTYLFTHGCHAFYRE